MSNLDGPPYYDSGLGDVPVPAAVAPLAAQPDGSFPSMRTSCIIGAPKLLSDLTSRDAIPAGLRAEGMIAYVQATGLTYQLQGGITNGDWVDFATPATTPTLAQVLVAGNTSGPTNLLMAARAEEAKGADVASGTTITLGAGNYFQVTGTGSIQGILIADWQSGAEVSLYFVAAATVVHNSGAPGVGAAAILLSDATDFTAAAGNVLPLRYDSALSAWVQSAGIARAGGGGGGESLAATLVIGNTTGGTSISVTNGDTISGQTVAVTGGTLPLRGGLATLAAGAGGPVTISTAASGAGTTYVERARVNSEGTLLVGDGTLAAAFVGAGANTAVQGYRATGCHVRVDSFSATPGDGSLVIFDRGRGTPAVPAAVANGDTIGGLVLQSNVTAASLQQSASILAYVDGTPSATSSPGRIVFSTSADGTTANTERARINNVGTTFFGNGTLTASFLAAGDASVPIIAYRDGNAQIVPMAFSNTALEAPILSAIRARGTIAAPAVVVSGDALSRHLFAGATSGTAFVVAGEFRAEADGNFSPTSAPGRLTFLTTPTGTTAPVERIRINSDGVSLFGNGTIATAFVGGGTNTAIHAYKDAGCHVRVDSFSATPGDGSLIVFDRARGTAAVPAAVSNNDTLGGLVFQSNVTVASLQQSASILAYVDGTPTASSSPGRLVFSTCADGTTVNAERVRINNLGTTFFGDGTLTTAAAFLGGGDATAAITCYRNDYSQIINESFSATALAAPVFSGIRGRGTAASPAVVQSGDSLLRIFGVGATNATNASVAAEVRIEVDGTPGALDMPGRLVFLTTPDGSAAQVEHLRISQDGNVLFTTLGAQAVSVNDAGNTSFTGAAAGATSLVGAINQVAAGTGAGAVRSLGVARNATGATRTLPDLSTTVMNTLNDRIELEARGSVDAAGTVTAGLGATTLYTSTSVAPGGADYFLRMVIVRVTDTTADWYATLMVEGSVAYAGGATAATVPSLTAGSSNAPFVTATGASSTCLTLSGTSAKAP